MPQVKEDPLAFLDSIPQQDPLSFLGPGAGVFSAGGESLGQTAAGEPVLTPKRTDQDALQGMYTLLQRPDITPAQRARIERLIHKMRAGMAQDQAPGPTDSPIKQAALSLTQGLLSVPTGIASTLSRAPVVGGIFEPAARAGQEFIEGIEPTQGPEYSQTGQAATGALSYALGNLAGFGVASKPITAASRGLLGAAAKTSPRLAGRGAQIIDDIANRVAAKTGSAEVANAVRAVPVEALSGTIFQALVDPESLTTLNGIALSVLFGTVGALGEGRRITKLAQREAKLSKAKDFADIAEKNNDTAAKTAADIQVKAADEAADKTARGLAQRAWNRGTKEMRKTFMPGFDDAVIARPWKNLTDTQKDALTAKMREIVTDSNLNQKAAAVAATEPTTAPTGTELAVPPGEPTPPITAPTTGEPAAGRPPETPSQLEQLKSKVAVPTKKPSRVPPEVTKHLEGLTSKELRDIAFGFQKITVNGKTYDVSPITIVKEAQRRLAADRQADLQAEIEETPRTEPRLEDAEIDQLNRTIKMAAGRQGIKDLPELPENLFTDDVVSQVNYFTIKREPDIVVVKGTPYKITKQTYIKVLSEIITDPEVPEYVKSRAEHALEIVKEGEPPTTPPTPVAAVGEQPAGLPMSTVTPEAPSGVVGSLDDEIAKLQSEVRIAREAQGQAERRAKAAERATQIDVTGVQSKSAWESAKARIDADPESKITLFDVRNFKALNDTKGQAAGDELLREIGNVLNNALKDTEQAFRVGGDEFVVVSKVGDIESVIQRVLSQFPDRPIEGTKFTLGLRSAVGNTYEGVSRDLVRAKAAETGPKARVVVEATPPAASVPEVKVGEKPAKPLKPTKPKKGEKARTAADVKSDGKKLDAQYKAGKIDEATYTYRIEKLKKELQTINAATTPAPKPEVVTRRQVDNAGVRLMSLEALRAEQTNLIAKREAVDLAGRAEIDHDLHVIQREIRMKKPVKELNDPSLDAHAKELQARWLDTPEKERGPLEARLAEVDLEYKNRKRPNIVDAIRNERGSIYASPDPLESSQVGLPEHSQRIQNKLEIDLEGDKPFPSIQDIFDKISKAYAHTIRFTHPADVASKQLGVSKKPTIQNPSNWAELLSGSLGRAQRMLQYGPFLWDAAGNIVDTGLKGMAQILQPLKGRLNKLRRYEVARYTIEMANRNKQSGIELLDAVREVQNADPDIAAAASELVAFRRSILDYLVQSGMFSQQAREALVKLGQAYVPIYRYLEGKGISESVRLVGAKASAQALPTSTFKQIQQMIQLKIVDPLRSTVEQTRRSIVTADKNRLGTILVEAAEQNPEAAKGLIWKDPHLKTSIEPEVLKQADALKKGAAQHGVTLTQETAVEIALGFSEKRLRTRSDQLQIWRNGKREVWNISPELAAMYEGFQPHELHWMVKLLGFLPQALKTGITDNPVFGFFNAMKDTFDASLQSKYGFRLGTDSVIGFLNSVSNSKYRQEFLAGAGTAGGITGRAVSSTRRALGAVLPKTPNEKFLYPIIHPIDALRELSIPFEEAARLGEYIRARQSGAPVMDAAIAAQRVTTNFRQRGLSMQGLNHIVVFLNPALQSLDTNARALKTQPGRVLAKGIAAISIPSIYLWAANRDDQKIQELRKSRFGANYWYYRKNDGRIGRLAKPFLFGTIFGTGVEDALDALYQKDPTAGERFIQSLVHNIPYNLVPTTLNFTLGLVYNKDFSTGAPIAPDRLESGDGAVLPRYQARPETGPTARALGDLLNISPAKIEFAVRNSLGTLGQDVLRLVDMANDAKDRYPAPVDADIPVVGRLLARYPSAGAFSIRRFYDNARKHERIINSMHLLEKEGRIVELQKFLEENKFEIGLAEIYADARQDLAEMRAASEAFATLPPEAMDSRKKRETINGIVDKMIQLSRLVNENVEKIRAEQARQQVIQQ